MYWISDMLVSMYECGSRSSRVAPGPKLYYQQTPFQSQITIVTVKFSSHITRLRWILLLSTWSVPRKFVYSCRTSSKNSCSSRWSLQFSKKQLFGGGQFFCLFSLFEEENLQKLKLTRSLDSKVFWMWQLLSPQIWTPSWTLFAKSGPVKNTS